MSDFDLDALLAGVVDDYQRNTLPQIKPAGSAAARATATQRRRVRTAAISAVALVVVAAPIAAYAATDHDHNGPPNVGSSQSASPAPSESPSATPSATASAALAPITEQDLANATLDLPTWAGGACPSGTATLHNGQIRGTGTVATSFLTKVVSVDLDHDGSADAVAVFECQLGNPSSFEAVGFHRAPDNSIQTLGPVVTGINTIADARAGDGGTVQLQVSNLAGSDGSAMASQVLQWRTYEWVGTRFSQTGGSTSFTVAVPALSVTVSDLVFEAPVNGKRAGTMRVTLHNAGSTTISGASVVYELTQAPMASSSPSCDPLPHVPMGGVCHVAPIAPGATATVTLTLSGDQSTFSGTGTFPLQESGEYALQVNVGDQKLATQPKPGNMVVK